MKSAKLSYTIWGVVKPVYWTLRVFGLAPYSIEGDMKHGNTKTNIWDIFHFLLVLILQFYIFYINAFVDLSLSRTNKFLIDKGAHGVEIFNSINLILGTCIYCYNRKKVWAIFQKCNEFDEEVAEKNSFILNLLLIYFLLDDQTWL